MFAQEEERGNARLGEQQGRKVGPLFWNLEKGTRGEIEEWEFQRPPWTRPSSQFF